MMALTGLLAILTFVVGSSRNGHVVVGAIAGVFLAYPIASSLGARFQVSQTQLLTLLLLCLGAAVAAQVLSPIVSQRDGRVRARLALPIIALTVLMWVHVAPVILEERIVGRSLWLTEAAVCLLLLASPRVSGRALALALVAVAGGWLVVSSAQELEASAIWGARAVMMAGLAIAVVFRRSAMSHVALAACLGVLLFLGKQGPLAGLLLGWSWFAVQRMRPRPRAFILCLAAITLVLLQTVIDLSFVVATRVDDAGTATIRLNLYGQAVDQFLQAPLLGHGFGGFRGSVDGRQYVYPHNIVVEALAEYGVMGLVIFGVAILGQWRRIDPPLIPLYLGTLIAAMFSGSVELNHEFWVVAAAGAVGVTGLARRPAEPDQSANLGRSEPQGA